MKRATLKQIKELRQNFLDDTFGKDVPKRNSRHYDKWLKKIGVILTDHREFMSHKLEVCRINDRFPDNFNLVYDQEYALETLRDDIQRWYRKRDWTFSDHQFAKLVCLNID